MRLNAIGDRDVYSGGCVYSIVNTITNDIYYGQTSCLSRRIYQHTSLHSKHESSSSSTRTVLYEDFNRYGLGSFELRIVHFSESKKLRLKIERIKKTSDPFSYRYSKREFNRNTTKKHSLKRVRLIDTVSGAAMYFNSPKMVTKQFKTERSTIIRALKSDYLYMKRYMAEYIHQTEFDNNVGQTLLF